MRFPPSLPFLFLGLAGVVLLIGRSGWQRLRYGGWGISVKRVRDRERPVHLGGPVLVGLLVAQAILWAKGALPSALRLADETQGLAAAGVGVCLVSLLLMVVAQLQMGRSWRVGIDVDARPGLVRHGLFGWSRNPIYLSIFLMLGGLGLLMPTWLSLGLLIAAILTVRGQVATEESYLLRSYGDEYRDYQRAVGRFLPLIGRLR